MKALYKRLRGMPDLVPEQMSGWQRFESAVRTVMREYSYGEMRTPLVESTDLFVRSIGEATDIVEKEMYTWADRKGSKITLRPENTAGCVRAVIENGLLQPGSVERIWYSGPMFRYERPQLGRQRQFFQTGAEVYGLSGAAIEAELILLSRRLWRELGIEKSLTLEINTLGAPEDRASYRDTLVNYFNQHKNALDEDSLRRLSQNPLRILDSKNPALESVIADAPKLADSLGESSRQHFSDLQSHLRQNNLEFNLNPNLVRGLDYYSHTVFEWTTDQLGAQSAVCGGGRYDGLLEQMGAPGVPGVGWALGMERVLALMEKLEVIPERARCDIFVVCSDDVSREMALQLAEAVRDAAPGYSVAQHNEGGSMKSQFKKADKSGAAVALIVGADEQQAGTVTIKPLRSSGEQKTVTKDAMGEALASILPPLN
ncbi:MAG: histidine--tRNA ligase [Gammaproteobacteria bacterium]|nr:histidine--tRNA ligase [Gammaproteobacteria bacterium]